MKEENVAYIQNAPALVMLVMTVFVSVIWCMVTFPTAQLSGSTVFIEGVVYLFFLVFTFVGFLIAYVAPNISQTLYRVIDFGNPDNIWIHAGIGLGVGAIVVVPLVLSNTGNVALGITEPLLVFFVAFVGPIVEDLFFRGVLLPSLGKFLPAWLSVPIVSAGFSAFHVNTWGLSGIPGLLFPFFLSVGLCVMTLYFESVIPSIITHLVINGGMALITVSVPTASAIILIFKTVLPTVIAALTLLMRTII